MKSVYAIQPYQVGSKDGKSLALIIPAKVAKQYNIDTSTVFMLRLDEDRKQITLQTINEDGINNHGQKLEVPVVQQTKKI